MRGDDFIMNEIERFELLMHGVQALRRHVEYLACPISGASGIRAQFYPHQVQNVQRILSAPRIRHLIADEVGMGKTIQALMIANALRLQAGKLRVRIVVPRAELKNQWIDEIAWRAQCIAELGDETVGDDWFDVVDDSTISKRSETLAPETCDLLILDEPQSLKSHTLRYVATQSANYAHLLLLTASPNLRDMRRFLELLQILEPDRVARARREADGDAAHEDLDRSRGRIDDLGDRERGLIYERFIQNSANVTNGQMDTSIAPEGVSENYESFADYRRVRVLVGTRWQYRNVLRSYREDFPNHLPRRIPVRLFVEATSAERDRMQAALSYIGGFLQEHRNQEHRRIAVAFLQRASLGGHTLQNRLIQLRRGNAENEPRLTQMSDLCRREIADSRLDRIVDWLIHFWQEDPKRKVVLAAEDNVTVEELNAEIAWRIPEVGRRGERIKLNMVLAKDVRTSGEEMGAPLESHTLENYANSVLRAFEESEDQLLIAHHVYSQSYNLQAADALIFYALPWKPEDVDQWIGRVDRLGREFVDPERPSSRPTPVHIVTLHRLGDPTIAVQEVLDEYRVLETAIDPERRLFEAISEEIEARALPFRSAPYCDSDVPGFDIEPELGRIELSRPRRSKVTAPPSGSTWTVEQAIELHRQVARREDLGPTLRQIRPLGYVTSASEEALATWTKLLRNQKWINIVVRKGEKQPGGRRSRTFYTLGQDKSVPVKLDSVQDRNHPFPPFFIARGNIQRPPRTLVETGEDRDGRPRYDVLQFLSFGSRLHEDLVHTFRKAGRATVPFGIRVYSLGPRHYPQGTTLAKGVYLCGVGFIDPAHSYQEYDAKKVLLGTLSTPTTIPHEVMRARALRRFEAGLLADARFVRMKRQAAVCCLAWRRVEPGNRLEPIDVTAAADLLGGVWSKPERPNAERRPVSAEYMEAIPAFCAGHIVKHTRECWAAGMDQFRDAVAERQEMLRIDMFDRIWVLEAAAAEIEAKIEQRKSHPTDANRRAITRYRLLLQQLLEERDVTVRSYNVRIELLATSLQHTQSPDISSVDLQCSAIVELLHDPVPLPADDEGETESDLESSDSTHD